MVKTRGWGATCLLVVFLVLASGCNLSPTVPTPRVAPTATFVPPLGPGGDLLQATAAVGSPNPNCPSTPPGWVPYVVEPGDSMGLLAFQTDSTVQDLTLGNCLDNPDQIEVGATLYLPRPPTVGGS